MRFHPAQVLGFDILVYVKHRAPPPLIYHLRALAAPDFRYFKSLAQIEQTAFQGGFFVGRNIL
jgi:hypothetical protein